MITKEQIEEFFKKNYYVSNDLLTYYTLISLNLMKESKTKASGVIYTTTLDGPPGAGKSMYAKLYAKMVHEFLHKKTVLISYQCDDSTSKIELFEDINVGAAVASEPEKVNTPGILARAINETNKGNKVILFIDEYDKTREQVDSLFLQMLQDGIINTNQFGDLKIEEKYKGNIQVIFCKNDFRTELTGPLTRRTRIINLDIIKPADFKRLAMRRLYDETEDKQEISIINLISLVYEEIYKHRDEYKRVCATSELFDAIEDLTYFSRVGAPKSIIYNVLLNDLFKNKEDQELFVVKIPNIENSTLKNILIALNEQTDEKDESALDIINNEFKKLIKINTEALIKEEKAKLQKIEQELAAKKQELDDKISKMNQEKIALTNELDKINEAFNKLVSNQQDINNKFNFNKISEFALNFDDATNHIRRGHHIFEAMDNIVEIARFNISLKDLDNAKLVNAFLTMGAIIYENGFLFTEPADIIITRTKPDIDKKVTFTFYMNELFLKKDAANKKNVYKNIANKLDKITDVIISLNKSDLCELSLKGLETYYKDYYHGYVSNDDIYKKILKKGYSNNE